jgi:hypothetical protein
MSFCVQYKVLMSTLVGLYPTILSRGVGGYLSLTHQFLTLDLYIHLDRLCFLYGLDVSRPTLNRLKGWTVSVQGDEQVESALEWS